MDNLMKTASRMFQHDLDSQSKVLLPRMCMNLKIIRTILKGESCTSWVRIPSKAPVVSLSKKCYPYCLVLVGSRNRLRFHNRTKIN